MHPDHPSGIGAGIRYLSGLMTGFATGLPPRPPIFVADLYRTIVERQQNAYEIIQRAALA